MGTVRVLSEADIRSVVGLGADELAAIEAVYPLISDRSASMPPIQRIDVPEHRGEIDVKSAYLPGYDGIAVKVSTGFFDNPSLGLPSLGGLMLLFDARTGVPRAALFDNGALTDLRTALAGAVAARHLARDDAATVAVLGAGVQARMQVEALRLVLPLRSALVWARNPERARSLADRLTGLGLEAGVATTPAEAAAAADVLVTATPATEPLVDVGMLHPGLHVTAVGADAEHKQELNARVIAAADLVACDHRAQSRRLGELRAAETARVDLSAVIELGEIVAGRRSGRTGVDQVTVCDLTGTGAQDTAIATLATRRCEQAGLGVAVET
jgi:ornithine cyclodeaminase